MDAQGSILAQNGRLSAQIVLEEKTAQNKPKLRESCASWQKLCSCAKTRKLRKSDAPQHRNFLGALILQTSILYRQTNLNFKLIVTSKEFSKKTHTNEGQVRDDN